MSDTNNCLSVIQSYADFLTNSTDHASSIPHPLLFSEANCSGLMWPPFAEPPPMSIFVPNPFPSGQFKSLYIPPFWQVKLKNNIPTEPLTRLICSSGSPFLEANAGGMFLDKFGTEPQCFGQADTDLDLTRPSLADNLGEIRFDLLKPNTGGAVAYSAECWLMDRCLKRVSDRMGTRVVQSFQPGSQECDDLMLTHCSGSNGGPCQVHQGPNSTLPECSCLLEETDLVCQGPDCEDEAVLPVTCFGGRCAVDGYIFGRMRNQKCGLTLCQQVVDIVGDAVAVNSNMQMNCGEPVTTSTSSNKTIQSSGRVFQTDVGGLTIAIACLLLILFCVLLPLSIFLLRN